MLCRSLKFISAELGVQIPSTIKTPSLFILMKRNIFFLLKLLLPGARKSYYYKKCTTI